MELAIAFSDKDSCVPFFQAVVMFERKRAAFRLQQLELNRQARERIAEAERVRLKRFQEQEDLRQRFETEIIRRSSDFIKPATKGISDAKAVEARRLEEEKRRKLEEERGKRRKAAVSIQIR